MSMQLWEGRGGLSFPGNCHLLDSGTPWQGPNTPLGPSSAHGKVRPAVLGCCTLMNAGLWDTGAQTASGQGWT